MAAAAREKTIGRQPSRIRLVFLSLAALMLGTAVLLCLIFLLLNSPSAVNGLAAILEPVVGYGVRVDDVSFSAGLKGNIMNLRITPRGDRCPLVSLDQVDFKANPKPLSGTFVEKIVLYRPRFRFILKPDKKETDWSGLDRVPPVKLLQIKDGEIYISGATYRIIASHLDVAIRDFSPRKGGRVRLSSALAVNGLDREAREVATLSGDGTISAEIMLASLFPRLAGNGAFSVQVKSANLWGLSFRTVSLDAPLSLDSEKLLFERTALRIGSLHYDAHNSRAVVDNVTLDGSGSFDRRSALLALTSVKGQLGDGGGFSGNGIARLSDSFPWKASFSARSIDFASLFAVISPFLADDYRKWGVQGKGDLTADVANGWSGESGFSGVLKLLMRNAGFSSADKTKAGASLTGEVLLHLGSPSSSKKDFKGRLEMKGGEFLWGSYYKDFKGERLSLSSTGEFSLGPEAFLSLTGDVDFCQTGDYAYRASFKEGFLSLDVTAKNVSAQRLHDLLLKDYFGEDSALSGLVLSGVSDFEMSLIDTEGGVPTMAGRVRVANLSLNMPKPELVLEKLDVDLPFDLSSNTTDRAETGDHKMGFVRLKRFQRGNILIQNLEMPVMSSRNRFQTLKDIDVDLFGGGIRVGVVQILNPLAPLIEVSTRITGDHLDLSRITGELLGVAVDGVVDADLGYVSLRQGRWTSSGIIRTKVFGGEVEIKNLWGEDLLAPSRTVAGDIIFGGIDLEQVTNLIEAGKVTGFIKGSITDFAFTYGEPSSFVLMLESDTSKSAPRMISVDAIENLSIIGTGSSGISAVLNSGINRFFKAYPYSEIGIRCTLKNDTFRLNGTIRDGNREYLVRRGLFRGIDVINQNPDNAISFRDMQERIGRIFKSGKVRTEIS